MAKHKAANGTVRNEAAFYGANLAGNGAAETPVKRPSLGRGLSWNGSSSPPYSSASQVSTTRIRGAEF